MQIIKEFLHFPRDRKRVIAIGAFDGVHKGHVQLLNKLVACAQQLQAESVVLTFSPHPQQVLHPEQNFLVINSLQQKTRLLENIGIDTLMVVPFTLELSEMGAEQFYQEIIVDKIGATHIIMGPNHAVGKNRKGDHQTIEKIVEKLGVTVIDIPEYMYHNMAVRSTQIRQLLQAGDIAGAEALLGYKLEDIKV